MGINVLEKCTASIFRAKVRSVRKWMVYVELGGQGQGVHHSETLKSHV
jgi:hypothetical protein